MVGVRRGAVPWLRGALMSLEFSRRENQPAEWLLLSPQSLPHFGSALPDGRSEIRTPSTGAQLVDGCMARPLLVHGAGPPRLHV